MAAASATAAHRLPILYLQSSASTYGSDRALLELLRHLDRDVFEPIVVVPEDGPLVNELEACGIETQILPLSILHRTYNPAFWLHLVVRLPLSAFKLGRLVRRRGIVLVHSNTSHVLDGAFIARAAGVAHVWHVREIHTWSTVVGPLLRRLVFARAHAIVCVSQAVRHAVALHRASDPRLRVVIDGVDLSAFSPDAAPAGLRRELGWPPGTPLVALVGRIAHWKGHGTLLDAATLVHDKAPAVAFLVIGDAQTKADQRLEAELRARVEQRGLGRSVRFLGRRADMPAVFADIDVLVVCSELPEAWGLVVCEAMAAGKPVVAAAAGGPLESVVHGKTGYLVPPRDASALAQAIMRLTSDPELAVAMGRAGRTRCEQQYPLAQTADQIRSIYLECCARRECTP